MITRSAVLTGVLGTLVLAACGPDASPVRPDAPPPSGARCGNFRVEPENGEECDDGNTVPGDGCTNECKTEQLTPAVCGDGIVAATEGCDDGDTMGGDGCSGACAVETGYTCSGQPSTCVMQPNNAMGTCQNPFVLTLAAGAQGDLTGSGTGDTSTGSSQVAAAPCDGGEDDAGAGNDHVWRFTLPETRDVFVLMPSTVSFDAIIRLQSAACDVTTEIPQFTGAGGCSDGGAAMQSEALAYTKLPAGTYYVVVDGFDAAAKGTYQIRVIASTTTCGDGELDLLDFCDDGNSMSGDGCSDKCEVENGYECDGEPSVCTMGGGNAVPPAAGDLVINEVMIADNTSDTNCDNSTNNSADEFIELVNASTKTLDLTGVRIDDANSLAGTQGSRHVFGPAAGGSLTLAPGKAVVVWGGGTPSCAGVTNRFVASSGSLGLNDTGDTITVRTAGASPVKIVEKVFAPADVKLNISRTLDPDITGAAYIDHPTLGGMRRWSPGRKADDTAF